MKNIFIVLIQTQRPKEEIKDVNTEHIQCEHTQRVKDRAFESNNMVLSSSNTLLFAQKTNIEQIQNLLSIMQ